MPQPPNPRLDGAQTATLDGWIAAGAPAGTAACGDAGAAGSVVEALTCAADQIIRPGELGVMTSGHAIAHSEQSPVPHPAELHGVQLWVALPEAARDTAPAWQHVPVLPGLDSGNLTATVFMGSLDKR